MSVSFRDGTRPGRKRFSGAPAAAPAAAEEVVEVKPPRDPLRFASEQMRVRAASIEKNGYYDEVTRTAAEEVQRALAAAKAAADRKAAQEAELKASQEPEEVDVVVQGTIVDETKWKNGLFGCRSKFGVACCCSNVCCGPCVWGNMMERTEFGEPLHNSCRRGYLPCCPAHLADDACLPSCVLTFFTSPAGWGATMCPVGCLLGGEWGSDLCGCFTGNTAFTCKPALAPGCIPVPGGDCCITFWTACGLAIAMSIAASLAALIIGHAIGVVSTPYTIRMSQRVARKYGLTLHPVAACCLSTWCGTCFRLQLHEIMDREGLKYRCDCGISEIIRIEEDEDEDEDEEATENEGLTAVLNKLNEKSSSSDAHAFDANGAPTVSEMLR